MATNNIQDKITNIKLGSPYKYPAGLTKGKEYTITYNSRGKFVLSNNRTKNKEILTIQQVTNIIHNSSI